VLSGVTIPAAVSQSIPAIRAQLKLHFSLIEIMFALLHRGCATYVLFIVGQKVT